MNDSVANRKPEEPRPLMGTLALTKVTTLGERLRGERQRAFVGRARELSLFERLLVDSSHNLLFLRGQVGVGKSALLQEFQRIALANNHPTVLVDAQVLGAASTAARALPRQDTLASFRNDALLPARSVLLVDGFEQHEWLLTELVADLPSDVLLVCASRSEPPSWLALDPAWSRLMVHRELQPLAPLEVGRYLELAGVLPQLRDSIIELAAGFPLALAIAADVARKAEGGVFAIHELQAVQHAVARSLYPKSVTPGQQLALEVCVLARTTTAELFESVRHALPFDISAEPEDPFNWLAHQSFVEWTPAGLRPHHLVRFAIQARLRREKPRRHRALLQTLREILTSELEVSKAPAAELGDLNFVMRNEPGVRVCWGDDEAPAKALEPALPSDHPKILALVHKAEGEQGAALVSSWLQRDDSMFEVLRDYGVCGVLGYVRFSRESGPTKLPSLDPVSSLVRRFMLHHPLDRDEEALLVRWSFEAEEYQAPSQRMLPLDARHSQLVLASKQLAYSLGVLRLPNPWASGWKRVGLPWQHVDTFKSNGHDYALVAFMWKQRSLRQVLMHSAAQVRAATPGGESALSFDELRIKVRERVASVAHKVKLTPREVEILERLCLGHSAEEIARQLSIRPRTVKFHQENLLRKTGANSRVELFRKLL
jgi:DNA-binding CsgD family transcriptional regulator